MVVFFGLCLQKAGNSPVDRCNTAEGFRAGEILAHIPPLVDFSSVLPGRVKEKGLFLVYQHPCSYCNSLSMNRYGCPELLDTSNPRLVSCPGDKE